MAGLVLEKRSFPRVSLAASGMLVYREVCYSARLENISLCGALVSFQEGDCPPISRGERCNLSLDRGWSGAALRLTTRMVHFSSDLACVRFVNLDQDTRLMLRSMIARQMPESSFVPVRTSQCQGWSKGK